VGKQREGKSMRARERGGVRGEKRASGAPLSSSRRSAVALITAESGDQGRSTELLAVSRKTTSREDGLGISWAESGLAFSPEQKKKENNYFLFLFLFSKPFVLL
jgi:hypothetical protein